MFEFLESAKFLDQVDYLIRNLPFAVWETLYTTLIATAMAYVIGLPLGVLLVTGEAGGIHPLHSGLMKILNTVVNLLRSVPFLILMVLVIPLTRMILGTSVGTAASVVPLVAAASPFVARLVEGSLREMDKGIIEAAQSMGCSPMQMVMRVLLPECRPSLITGFTTAFITILGYGAMAGAIGAGGLGSMAINYGFNRTNHVAMWVAVIVLVILVQIIQSVGTRIARKSDKRLSKS